MFNNLGFSSLPLQIGFSCINNGKIAIDNQQSVVFGLLAGWSIFPEGQFCAKRGEFEVKGQRKWGVGVEFGYWGMLMGYRAMLLFGGAVFNLQLIYQLLLTKGIRAEMTERKIWKVQEDHILKELFEARKIKKWSQISRIMEKNYGIEGRNGKQCRERYHNHLKGGIKKEKWTKSQENYLVALHALHGNRWALISKLIQGRTENCVKNMLYSKLRKSIRQLNRFSYQYYRKTLKEIKISFIYRLVEFTENSYRKCERDRTQQENMALRLKNQILQLDFDEDANIPETEKERIKQLIDQIHIFKRLNQRFRGNHGSKNKPKRVVKIEPVEEDVGSVFEAEEESESEEEMEDSLQQAKKDTDEAQLEIKQGNLANSEKNTQDEAIVKAHDSISTHIEELKEPAETFKSKFSILRMDSLESNLSLLLVDAGLENPIQTQHQFLNLTPTPYHPGIIEDWNVLNSTSWRNNFTFE